MKKTLLTLLALVMPVSTALATTLEKLTFEEIVDDSALIIQAKVIEVSSAVNESLPSTRVVFKVEEVLKGDDPGEFVELYFLGGDEQANSMHVAGQDIPETGERGFYFIENPDERSVNPLTGWSQGHFRILSDLKGRETLETDIRQDVVELSANKNAVLAAKLRNMKFGNALVEKIYYSPVTPDELRQAVFGILDGK